MLDQNFVEQEDKEMEIATKQRLIERFKGNDQPAAGGTKKPGTNIRNGKMTDSESEVESGRSKSSGRSSSSRQSESNGNNKYAGSSYMANREAHPKQKTVEQALLEKLGLTISSKNSDSSNSDSNDSSEKRNKQVDDDPYDTAKPL